MLAERCEIVHNAGCVLLCLAGSWVQEHSEIFNKPGMVHDGETACRILESKFAEHATNMMPYSVGGAKIDEFRDHRYCTALQHQRLIVVMQRIHSMNFFE